MRYTAFGSGVSTEMPLPSDIPRRFYDGYTAFGSGVSTEMSSATRPRDRTPVVTQPSAQG